MNTLLSFFISNDDDNIKLSLFGNGFEPMLNQVFLPIIIALLPSPVVNLEKCERALSFDRYDADGIRARTTNKDKQIFTKRQEKWLGVPVNKTLSPWPLIKQNISRIKFKFNSFKFLMKI